MSFFDGFQDCFSERAWFDGVGVDAFGEAILVAGSVQAALDYVVEEFAFFDVELAEPDSEIQVVDVGVEESDGWDAEDVADGHEVGDGELVAAVFSVGHFGLVPVTPGVLLEFVGELGLGPADGRLGAVFPHN